MFISPCQMKKLVISLFRLTLQIILKEFLKMKKMDFTLLILASLILGFSFICLPNYKFLGQAQDSSSSSSSISG